MRVASLVLLAVLLGLGFAPSLGLDSHASASRVLVVNVVALRNDQGEVRGALYDSAERWLDSHHPAASCVGVIHGGRARCVFRDAPAGAVSFAGMHDEDGDGEMDRDLLGIPTEGYAFSNDVRPSLSAPSFESALIPMSRATVAVHTRYGI